MPKYTKKQLKKYEALLNSDKPMPKPKQKCCNNPDVKNEGMTGMGKYYPPDSKKEWNYYCYRCSKVWSEEIIIK